MLSTIITSTENIYYHCTKQITIIEKVKRREKNMLEVQAEQLIKMNKNKKPTTSKLGRQKKIELNEKNDIIAKSDYSEPN